VRRKKVSPPSSKAILLLAVLGFLGCPALFGQRESGAIQGTVTDQSGAVIPNAKVTLSNEETGFTLPGSTASAGTYVFNPIKIGTYKVTVEVTGFEKSIRSGIAVHVQEQVVVDFILIPGLVTQSVEVTGKRRILLSGR
jgi:Carboxypeptidase regulatory-like domain